MGRGLGRVIAMGQALHPLIVRASSKPVEHVHSVRFRSVRVSVRAEHVHSVTNVSTRIATGKCKLVVIVSRKQGKAISMSVLTTLVLGETARNLTASARLCTCSK